MFLCFYSNNIYCLQRLLYAITIVYTLSTFIYHQPCRLLLSLASSHNNILDFNSVQKRYSHLAFLPYKTIQKTFNTWYKDGFIIKNVRINISVYSNIAHIICCKCSPMQAKNTLSYKINFG